MKKPLPSLPISYGDIFVGNSRVFWQSPLNNFSSNPSVDANKIVNTHLPTGFHANSAPTLGCFLGKVENIHCTIIEESVMEEKNHHSDK